MWRFFTRVIFCNRFKQISERKWRYRAPRASDVRAKITSCLSRVFRLVAPLKKFSLLMRTRKFLSCGPWLAKPGVWTNFCLNYWNTFKTSHSRFHFRLIFFAYKVAFNQFPRSSPCRNRLWMVTCGSKFGFTVFVFIFTNLTSENQLLKILETRSDCYTTIAVHIQRMSRGTARIQRF